MARWCRLPTIPVKPLPMLGLAIGGLVWAVAIPPRRQPLEGALQATGVSFAMAGADRATPTGVLVVAVRALSIRGPDDGDTLALPFSKQTLALTGDSATLGPEEVGALAALARRCAPLRELWLGDCRTCHNA